MVVMTTTGCILVKGNGSFPGNFMRGVQMSLHPDWPDATMASLWGRGHC